MELKNTYHITEIQGIPSLICNKQITLIDNELRKKIGLDLIMIRSDLENPKLPKTIEGFVVKNLWGHMLTFNPAMLVELSDNDKSLLMEAVINDNTVVLSNVELENIKNRLLPK